jgi:phosphotransferase system HPr (HPr) family protein
VVPTSSEAQVTLPPGVDLHARPAAEVVRAAMGHSADITLGLDDREVDAKSLLAVLALGAKGGTSLRLAAHGDDADAAVESLAAVFAALG